MNERWRYQIKKGWPFGMIMPIIMISVDCYGSSSTITEVFLSKKFLVYLLVFLFFGVFVFGYSSWREKRKNNEYNNQK